RILRSTTLLKIEFEIEYSVQDRIRDEVQR
ncbi:unnamed protein product, partial [Rotaria sordida]